MPKSDVITHIELKFEDTISFHDTVAGKVKAPGARRPICEFISGDSFWRNACKWMLRTLKLDRYRDEYFEEIVDPETGEQVHQNP